MTGVETLNSLKLSRLLVKVSVMNELQYRVNFFIYLFQTVLELGTGLVVIGLVFSKVNDLGGWTRPQLMMVLGVFTLIGGLVRAVIQPNMNAIMENIQDGTFDHVLTKPVSAQLFVSVRSVQLWQLVDVLAGVAIIVVAGVQLNQPIGVGAILSFLATLVLGITLIYSFWLAMTTTAFWVVRIDPINHVFEGLFQAGRWPVGVYPGWMKLMLTFLAPIGFAITVPAEALTGRLSWSTGLLALGLAVAAFLASRWFFRFGTRHYSGASA